MIGTRGVPARYGGFETAIEEVGKRLVKRGHEVTVYCRGDDRSAQHLGMRRVRLPALRSAVAETLSHTALSVVHLLRHRADVALVFNSANSPLLPLVRLAQIPVAVHVDGLEWQRAKWGPIGRRYYRFSERLAVLWADDLIADAVGIQRYYRDNFGVATSLLTYGAPIIDSVDHAKLRDLDLEPGAYHLVVARLEPENHVDVIIRGYAASACAKPLVVVGSVPYPSDHEREVQELAARDPRIRLLGGVWDQQLLDALYAGSASYLHGHSVGGTNPSLLRAMGGGASVIAWDVEFNREVLAGTGEFFRSPGELTALLEQAEVEPDVAKVRGRAARVRAASAYRWDDVAVGYEELCLGLAARSPARARTSGRHIATTGFRAGRGSGCGESHEG
jgi:glycosyltransferase involved in cell wall biosynthesis